MVPHNISSVLRGSIIILFSILTLIKIPFVTSATFHFRDSTPRAAFVSLVAENQLNQMVASVRQLEQHFNNKYHYDWVLFSQEELSENFKDSTSNATTGTVTYNVIPTEHWQLPNSGNGVGTEQADIWNVHHKRRWSAGLFAREKRLEAFDWFWMVEPGTQFVCDINVDVFRLMRDRDIIYGVNEISFEESFGAVSLWQTTQRFIDKHPEVVRPQADISWILGRTGRAGTPTINMDNHHGYTGDSFDNGDYEICESSEDIEGGVHPDVSQEADPQQCEPYTVADSYTTRLDANYNHCNFEAPIEIGNLKYFRSPEHSLYFEHLDNAGDFYYSTIGNAPIHSLSASMFLPRDKVWLLNDLVCQMGGLHSCPPSPRQTPDLDIFDDRTLVADLLGSTQVGSYKDDKSLQLWHRVWDCFVIDFERQEKIPSPCAGYTTIDERNFKSEQWFLESWVKLSSDEEACSVAELTFSLRDSCSAEPLEHGFSHKFAISEWLEFLMKW
ncbi:alpha-mannosyltransferase [Colletotrichum truncatum]|uniref:Alpha-mannosyltransferase n=1 Tax=Colletotrichum truncatum TaxID=5467 RepID=A0ACC3ZDN3_COLTU|nr:alpha-mannosyltransferase [Colletotrichum truncatum]KAF6797977.1 alpha-mannosyltransferase [Colletotrichum truncatum]